MTGLASDSTLSVVVYSQRDAVRHAVRTAVGKRAGVGQPPIEWIECANYSQVKDQIDRGDIDLLILDGDAQPTGGMGLARQFKNEIADCPPIIVIVARQQDSWLASWSQADAVLVQPLDPVITAETVATTLREHASAIPVIR